MASPIAATPGKWCRAIVYAPPARGRGEEANGETAEGGTVPYAEVLEISRDLFYTALLVALPALTVSLLVGLIVSVFQTVTSIQDQTISYVPRIIIVGLVIVLTMSFSLEMATHFTVRMLARAAEVSH
jgi:flagellar biosynthetic protein FliQ